MPQKPATLSASAGCAPSVCGESPWSPEGIRSHILKICRKVSGTKGQDDWVYFLNQIQNVYIALKVHRTFNRKSLTHVFPVCLFIVFIMFNINWQTVILGHATIAGVWFH